MTNAHAKNADLNRDNRDANRGGSQQGSSSDNSGMSSSRRDDDKEDMANSNR